MKIGYTLEIYCFIVVLQNMNTCPKDRQVYNLILVKSDLDGPVVKRVSKIYMYKIHCVARANNHNVVTANGAIYNCIQGQGLE